MRHRRAFTLLELVAVVAIIALLLGLLFPAIRSVRQSGDKTRELSAARQLMLAYRGYAYDHKGRLMPGYYRAADTDLGGDPLPVYDEAGKDLRDLPQGDLIAARYPWRLAPYLDYNMAGLYLDPVLRVRLRSDQNFDPEYLMSIYPSLGINSVFLGGDTSQDPRGGFGFRQDYLNLFGQFYKTRLSEVKRPAELIVFISARINGLFALEDQLMVQGFHKVIPPYFIERNWAESYVEDCRSPDCESSHFGEVSLRHAGREAAAGFLDGHTGALGLGGVQDMRHWSDDATSPGWVVEPP